MLNPDNKYKLKTLHVFYTYFELCIALCFVFALKKMSIKQKKKSGNIMHYKCTHNEGCKCIMYFHK